jgi:hypothetical protein
MVTFHPTFKQVVGGYIPMVNIRKPSGHMIGSRVARADVCVTAALALSIAYIAAFRACDACECARVAS